MSPNWSWLGRVGYEEGLSLQCAAVRRRQRGECGDRLLLLEHPHVFTVGRGGGGGDGDGDVLWDEERRRQRGVGLYHTDRGGRVTYHGPGQLVGYAVVDLTARGRDLHAYLRDVEEVVILALRAWGIGAVRRPGLTGVWVPSAEGAAARSGLGGAPAKIASVGVHVARWVTSHGFALNVSPDLDYFGGIVPCGQPDARVTSVLDETGLAPSLPEAAAVAGSAFERVFGLGAAVPEVDRGGAGGVAVSQGLSR